MSIHLRYCWLFLLLAGACKTTGSEPAAGQKQTQDGGPGYRQVAEQRLGKDLSYSWNKAGTLVLGQQVQQHSSPAQLSTVRLVVIRVRDNAIVHEDRLANARVTWYNNTQLHIYPYPGTVQGIPGRQPAGYLFDLDTKQKINLPSPKL